MSKFPNPNAKVLIRIYLAKISNLNSGDSPLYAISSFKNLRNPNQCENTGKYEEPITNANNNLEFILYNSKNKIK